MDGKSLTKSQCQTRNVLNLEDFYLVSDAVNQASLSHSCMPSPLAPDPIRVQSYVCCLFSTNRNSMGR